MRLPDGVLGMARRGGDWAEWVDALPALVDGLLERDRCTDDGRGAFAVLTDKGAEAVVSARTTHLGGVRERFLGHFDEDELQTLAVLWDRVLPGASGRE